MRRPGGYPPASFQTNRSIILFKLDTSSTTLFSTLFLFSFLSTAIELPKLEEIFLEISDFKKCLIILFSLIGL